MFDNIFENSSQNKLLRTILDDLQEQMLLRSPLWRHCTLTYNAKVPNLFSMFPIVYQNLKIFQICSKKSTCFLEQILKKIYPLKNLQNMFQVRNFFSKGVSKQAIKLQVFITTNTVIINTDNVNGCKNHK